MDDRMALQDGELPLHGAGEQLRHAREKAGMTIAQVAAETRITQRHLALIEAGDFNALPARTYATGFARTYARILGLDERAIVEEVRAELASNGTGERLRAATFEPGDPARVPSRRLALFSAFAVLLLLAGGFMFYNAYLAPGSGPGSLLDEQRVAAAQRAPVSASPAKPDARAPETGGPVIFTALEDGIWVKFYDGAGRQLMQKQMALGERYMVPEDASGPQVWTGRPDALAITVGGRQVPKLAAREMIVRDVPVTSEALLGRRATPAATGTAAPSGT